MRIFLFVILLVLLTGLGGCSVKKNSFFSRNYHQITTRYNVYFNGNQALKSGEKNMETRHKEDYTALLPVFVSNDEQTRALCSSDMDYAIEKAVKAIDEHSITVKPRRRKNKNSKSYQTFRRKREFNNQLDRCYLLLGKAYFYNKKYTMASNTFHFIQRQFPEDEKMQTETAIWLFRNLTEMERYDEAAQWMNHLEGCELDRRQQEMVFAARADFYIRQGMYPQAISETVSLANVCRNMKRKARYNFLLSQLYMKQEQDVNAMVALKKAIRFNFNYEMVFNAKVSMALANRGGDVKIEKQLKKMLKDSRNEDFRDRIYYALGTIEEERGEEEKAIELYWKSVRTSVDNDNQQALSFRKLGDYYFKERNYVKAQSCYDSCMYVIDSRYEDYDKLKSLLGDLTDLTECLGNIQLLDSVLHLANLPETERNQIIDRKIQEIRNKEAAEREEARQAMSERNFYERNNMLGNRGSYSSGNNGGEWYFYNPVTIAAGKDEFKRKWGRRKLEDHWRRQNKAMVDFSDDQELLAEESGVGNKVTEKDTKSREYYLQGLPMTDESKEIAIKKMEDAYYRAGELYLYRFDDPAKALECFDAYIRRFEGDNNLPMVYYLAYTAAEKSDSSAAAEKYKQELLRLYPESDFALSVLEPGYFERVGDMMKTVEDLYEQAYARYEQVYYKEAEQICDEILRKYPDNKLKANVLFLKAMCVLNTASVQEGKAALEKVLSNKPSAEMRTVVGDILASISTGNEPIIYTGGDMEQERYLHTHRNWTFDEKVEVDDTGSEMSTYQMEKDKEQLVLIVLNDGFNLADEMRFKARLTFINASEAAEGRHYELSKEELWYKQEAMVIRKFENIHKALAYFSQIATDKYLLKIIGDRAYRMYIMEDNNLERFKWLRNTDSYLEFFVDNYFEDRQEGEMLCGKHGTAAHIFNSESSSVHHLVLALPFHDVNTRRIAEMLHRVDPAFVLAKEDYNDQIELVVVKNVGTKGNALEYMNTVLKDREVSELLTGKKYEIFVITDQNLKAMQENEYLDKYVKYFGDNYLKEAGFIGVEDGEYVYNKNIVHRFVLIYPNTVDPFRLKAVFEELNFSGISLSNQRFDEENDYMMVSGLDDKEEAMRYFNKMLNNRKLSKLLQGANYTNFVITEANLGTLLEKKTLKNYLDFFRKYYLN